MNRNDRLIFKTWEQQVTKEEVKKIDEDTKMVINKGKEIDEDTKMVINKGKEIDHSREIAENEAKKINTKLAEPI